MRSGRARWSRASAARFCLFAVWGRFSVLRLPGGVTARLPPVVPGSFLTAFRGMLPGLEWGLLPREVGCAALKLVEAHTASWDTKGLSRGQPSCTGRCLLSWRAKGAGAFPSKKRINPTTFLISESLFIFEYVFLERG